MALRIVNWNVKWAKRHREEVLRRIDDHSPDLICLTETHTDSLPREGHQIESEADYGYPIKEGRRKVVLWSKSPWLDADSVGHSELPPGRFVAGRTVCDLGEVTVIGVCIPWSMAHVKSGRRKVWEDHIAYLDGLDHILESLGRDQIILVGDFNQRMSGRLARKDAAKRLQEVVSKKLEIATASVTFSGKETIDHLAHTRELMADDVEAISNQTEGGELSDHFGVALTLQDRHGG